VAVRKRILVGAGLAVVLVIVIGAVAIRRVSRPLQQLERVANQISQDLNATEATTNHDLADSALGYLKDIRSRDEIGRLASSFLHLVTRLSLYIRERKAAEEKITALARTDVLTGLPNRAAFLERLAQAFAATRRGANPLAVFYLDLDHFKDVNDTLGHAAGDALLQAVAIRLRASLRENDMVARLGGDEFVVLQTDTTDPSAAGVLADRIRTLLAAPYEICGSEIHLSASIGIAAYGGDKGEPDTILAQADAALYRAKEQGRDRYCFHSGAAPAGKQGEVIEPRRAAFPRNSVM